MAKIRIRVTIKNSETEDSYEVNAIIQDNIIKYREADDTKVSFDYNKNKLIRENNQMKMLYYFDNKEESSILVKEYDRSIKLLINTISIKKEKNNLEVNYKIDEEEFLYRIEEIV